MTSENSENRPGSEGSDDTPSGGDWEGHPSLEDRFIAGYDDSEPDEFDEELMDLVKTRQRGSVLRPILMIIVILLVAWVVYDWRGDIDYFFTSPDPVEVGDVADFSQRAAEDPEWEPPIDHNMYVEISGMPTRITSGGGFRFFRLQGAEIYVQQSIESDGDDERDSLQEGRTLPERNMGPGLPIDEHRTYYEGTGRLTSFASAPDRVAGLKEYYGERYNVRFCEDYTPRRIEDLEEQRLEIIRRNWSERYQEATEEERTDQELTPEPTDDEEQRLLNRNPVCVDAYLLQDDRSPMDHWWHVLAALLLSAFMLFTIYKLYAWFRDWLKP